MAIERGAAFGARFCAVRVFEAAKQTEHRGVLRPYGLGTIELAIALPESLSHHVVCDASVWIVNRERRGDRRRLFGREDKYPVLKQ